MVETKLLEKQIMVVDREQNRELTLPPETYLYLQNVGKGGLINVYCGPAVVNQTGQDGPIKFDAVHNRYIRCETLEQAMQICPRAKEGDYVVLENPSESGLFPNNNNQQAVPLLKGRKTIIAGPWSQALWPGQHATVVEGHRLRSNQYLIATIYNAEEAQKNWDATIAKAQTHNDSKTGNDSNEKPLLNQDKFPIHQKGLPKPDSFAVGTRIIIKGTDISFYIPCTGVEVLKDDNGKYVREAVTLEQLEYCCLVDESGKKEYPRGPMVVFPSPTQIFETDSKNRRKFSPIELNKINGIHLKVTADFEGPDIENNLSEKRQFQEGEELFVTGNTLSIYYPREELAIIEYGQGNKKHYSTAIPKGEGRYVINRSSGEIDLIRGPKMLLADPRTQIPVRRVLSIEECSLWYPDNKEALEYNLNLAEAVAQSPSGRSGVISEGDYRKRRGKAGLSPQISYMAGAADTMIGADSDMYESFKQESVSPEHTSGESIRRGTTFTPPKTLTLNTKYDGVPKIEVWSGYAVLVVGAEGSRRVVEGPQVFLLEYDEKLGFMELSSGKPKSTDKLVKTAYLCVQNNQVGDIVSFESKDHVKGKVKISLRVNFEAKTEEEKLKWFSVGNYVKYLCDHVRSLIAGMAKKNTIAEIKSDYINLVRETILGAKLESGRIGLSFADNGMKVNEVEVLDLVLEDASISKLLDETQHKVVENTIEIERVKRDVETTKLIEELKQQKLQAEFETDKIRAELQQSKIETEILVLSKEIEKQLTSLKHKLSENQALEEIKDLSEAKKLERQKALEEQTILFEKAKIELKNFELQASTESAIQRFKAAQEGLGEVLLQLSREDMVAKLAEATNIERFLSGDNISSSIANLLSISPSLKQFFEKAEKSHSNRIIRQTQS